MAAAVGARAEVLVYALPQAVPAALPIIAADRGFFRAEGLDVKPVFFSSGRDGLQALLSGQAQIQSVSETPVVHALLAGERVAVIATVARHHEAELIVRPDRGVRVPADLRGKRLATWPGTNSDYFMHRFLSAHGLKMSDARVIAMPPEEMVSAFVRGDIDGYFAWQPHVQFGLDAVPGSLVFPAGALYSGWMTVNMDPRYAAAHPAQVRAILRALLRAEAYARLHPDDCLAALSRRLHLPPKTLRALWADSRYRVELDAGLAREMGEIARWSMGLSGERGLPPNFRQYLLDGFLRAVAPRRVSL